MWGTKGKPIVWYNADKGYDFIVPEYYHCQSNDTDKNSTNHDATQDEQSDNT